MPIVNGQQACQSIKDFYNSAILESQWRIESREKFSKSLKKFKEEYSTYEQLEIKDNLSTQQKLLKHRFDSLKYQFLATKKSPFVFALANIEDGTSLLQNFDGFCQTQFTC